MALNLAQQEVSWDLMSLWEALGVPAWLVGVLLVLALAVVVFPPWRKKVFGR